MSLAIAAGTCSGAGVWPRGTDAAIKLREKSFAFDGVERVDVHVNPVVLVLSRP
ncbi:MAG: hypothetical protein AMDU1_APLC00030G0042 [Thermoplasmatales archaeon A-plasma]|nr:MAG: hypothetical protein AMDU1_APLC00030G0042 [Thermoplasmatales archaeon A-plasma]